MIVLCQAWVAESCSLGLECKVGGRVHLTWYIGLELKDNKYHEGNVKRTLKRGLHEFELVGVK